MVCWLRHSRQALSLKMICFSFLTCSVAINHLLCMCMQLFRLRGLKRRNISQKQYLICTVSSQELILLRKRCENWESPPHHQPQHKREVNKDTLLIRIVCNIAEASNGNDFATYCCIVLIIKSCARTGIWFVALFM